VNSHTMMKARLTHLAVLIALASPLFMGKLGWLGISDGAW
jgi:hypothetical protein